MRNASFRARAGPAASPSIRFSTARASSRRAAGPRTGRSHRRGLSIIYVALFLLVLLGVVSLAVDIGRVRLARAEVQNGADAAAHSGARSLPMSQAAVEDAAVTAAQDNPVIDQSDKTGQRVNLGLEVFPDDDVQVGIWDPHFTSGDGGVGKFTPLEDNAGTTVDERRAANAVYVVGRRIKARNNPIPLIFAPVVGVFSTDVEQRAIAYVHGGPDRFGFVGLDYVRANGNYTAIDSVLWPNMTQRTNGGVSSNGDIALKNSDIYGDVRPGAGADLQYQPNTLITGWTANLDSTLSYPVVDAMPTPRPPFTRAGVTPGNVLVPDLTTGVFDAGGNSNGSLQANRTYYFSSWVDTGKGKLTITGPATIYLEKGFSMTGTSTLLIKAAADNPVRFIVNGDFVATGGNIVNTGLPASLYISVIKPNSVVKIAGSTATGAHVYAPLSDVTMGGTPGFTGWIIGKSLTFSGTNSLHYDESRDDHRPFGISIVK